MKKLIVIALLSLSISGMAQEKKNRINEDRPQLTAEQQNELQVKKLTLELDLSAQQQKEIAKIVAKKQLKREAMRTELKSKKAEDKKLTSDEKFVLKRNMLDEQIAHKNEMKKVLTAEQYEKWEKMSKNKMKKGMQKMKNAQRTEK
jgi:protein CpxP